MIEMAISDRNLIRIAMTLAGISFCGAAIIMVSAADIGALIIAVATFALGLTMCIIAAAGGC